MNGQRETDIVLTNGRTKSEFLSDKCVSSYFQEFTRFLCHFMNFSNNVQNSVRIFCIHQR